MNSRLMLVLFFFALGALASPSQAEEDMPDYVRSQLDALVGEWVMEGKTGDKTVTLEISIHWAPSKAQLIYTWRGTDLGGEKNSGTGIFGWDAGKKAVVEQELDSDGSSFTSTHSISPDGKWVSSSSGTVVIEGKAKPLQSVRYFKLKSEAEWVVRSTQRFIDGEFQPDVVSTFRRE